MNIVVLCGGISSEREISLRSSSKLAKALKGRGHNVIMTDVFFGTDNIIPFGEDQDYDKTADELRAKNSLITEELIRETGLFGKNVLELCRKADVVFIGLHGENGEDGKIQAAFDKEGIQYTGSNAESSAIAMSKAETKRMVSDKIRMPDGIVLHKGEARPENMKLPCVIKPSNGGSSVGVMLVFEQESFHKKLEACFRYDDTVLIENYIEGLIKEVEEADFAYISNVCVDEKCRGKHIGKTMLNYVIDTYKQKLYDHIVLDVLANNPGAIKLYQNLGFEQFTKIFAGFNDPKKKKPDVFSMEADIT